jgi:hypothetical protein
LIQILSRVDSIVADSYFTERLRRLLEQYRPEAVIGGWGGMTDNCM